MHSKNDHPRRLAVARDALEGLSVGDAFGERFFTHPDVVESMIEERAVPKAPWRWTDDTAMALSVFEELAASGGIESSMLARRFAARYAAARGRGYGGGAHRLFSEVAIGVPWEVASAALFEGTGSYGNGGAMRVGPVGGYFADDLSLAALHSSHSARPTHAHAEGRAGAIAIGVAAAWAAQTRGTRPDTDGMFEVVLEHTPSGEVFDRIEKARRTDLGGSVHLAVSRLGNGSGISAQDTVGFTLWCAARHLEDYEEAMWATVAGLGDRDTTCAIVGGIVAAHLGSDAIPMVWRHSRESLGL